VLGDLEDRGQQRRAKGFLVGLTHPQYLATYRFVLTHRKMRLPDIQTALRAGRTEGKVILAGDLAGRAMDQPTARYCWGP
jgi:hypothetical protein